VIPVAIGTAWAVVVAAALARRARPPARAGALRPPRPATSAGVPALVGRALLRASVPLVGRRRSGRQPDPGRLGCTALALLPPMAALPFPMSAFVAAAAGAVVWWLPLARARRRDIERRRRLEAQLPEVVDLLVLAVGAGLTVPLALDAVARRGTGELPEELGRVVASSRQGHRLADALDALPARAGEGVRPLVAALVASERYGAPLAEGLTRLAAEVRATRRRRADEAARKVSVKLLFPLVLCVLPAFALLTVAPLIASALRSLRL
jgi:tight adherence protein C